MRFSSGTRGLRRALPMMAAAVTLLIASTGCQRALAPQREPLPLAYGLLGNSRLPRQQSKRKRLGRRPSKRRRSKGIARSSSRSARRRARCARRLLGKEFTSHPRATTRLLRCWGRGRHALRRNLATLPLRHTPQSGDLVLFDQARDANENGRLDDRRSALGIVLTRHGQRVTFAYVSGRRLRRGYIHLGKRNLRYQGTSVVNSYIRIKTPRDPRATRYLAGELLAGFYRPRR